jgi:hypothetical protein
MLQGETDLYIDPATAKKVAQFLTLILANYLLLKFSFHKEDLYSHSNQNQPSTKLNQ